MGRSSQAAEALRVFSTGRRAVPTYDSKAATIPRLMAVAMSALDEVRDQLAAIEPSGGFATRRTSPAGDLHLQVKGIGRIPFPISRANARRLAAIARPARYGLKDGTRLDPRVRDTGEIARSLVTLDQARWTRTIAPMLEQVRPDLGLPHGIELTAVLHNLLVYEPGQFFATHQDSEKTDDMIATLVVILPSVSTGGAMVIEHHDERVDVPWFRPPTHVCRVLRRLPPRSAASHERSPHRADLQPDGAQQAVGKGPVIDARRIQSLARSIETYFE